VAKEYVAGTGDLEGKYVLAVETVDGMELTNATNLKSALSKERTARGEAEKAAKAFDGIDAAAARDALDKVKTMDDWDPEEKLKAQKAKFERDLGAKFESDVAQLTKKHEDELGKANGTVDGLTRQLETISIDAAAREALAKHGGGELLMPHIRQSVRTRITDDGGLAVEVLDGEGAVRLSPASGSTAPMSIEEKVIEMKGEDVYAPAFGGSGATGGGATGRGPALTPGGQKTVSRSDPVAMGALAQEIKDGKVTVVD
jgi:hypothetical protein